MTMITELRSNRIDCLAGWRDLNTKVMTTNVCPEIDYFGSLM